MVFDEARQRALLLLSGRGATWQWDGENWVQLADIGPLMSQPGMTYDAGRKSVLATGGGSTWEWDGTAWTHVADTGGGDAARFGPATLRAEKSYRLGWVQTSPSTRGSGMALHGRRLPTPVPPREALTMLNSIAIDTYSFLSADSSTRAPPCWVTHGRGTEVPGSKSLIWGHLLAATIAWSTTRSGHGPFFMEVRCLRVWRSGVYESRVAVLAQRHLGMGRRSVAPTAGHRPSCQRWACHGLRPCASASRALRW
jgi:hypothetical protein